MDSFAVGGAVCIETRLTGASAEVVESAVTVPIERSLLDLEGLTKLSSSSTEGRSHIELVFPAAPSNAEIQRVQHAGAKAKRALPSSHSGSVVAVCERSVSR
jgi:multidrug efflux pump subunit AcrB